MPREGEEYKGYCKLCKKETTHVLHCVWVSDSDGDERRWFYFCLGCGTKTKHNYKQSTMVEYLF